MPSPIPIARTITALRKHIRNWRATGNTVALVPTMGALHEGHLSLIRLAQKKADKVVVTIFVNPSQFAPNEDLDAYPHDERSDRATLTKLAVNLIYAPKVSKMYPPDFSTKVEVERLSNVLCGVSRENHFTGVATVVTKLLLQALPDIAIFGEKDYQQLLVIKRLTRDLDIPVKILSGAIIREKDGLALSSRNAYLSPEERTTAPLLHKIMKEAVSELGSGRHAKFVLTASKKRLQKAGFKIDYLEVRHAETLTRIAGVVKERARLFAAAFLGNTRLIDNLPVKVVKRRYKTKLSKPGK